MKTVFVYNGRWRDQEIRNVEFKMVSDGVMEGKNGLYITVDKGDFISNSKNLSHLIKCVLVSSKSLANAT